MNRREFDASFKRMAIDLSYARGSVKEVADELGIDPGRLSKWRQKDSTPIRPTEGLTDEQREIKRLQKELKEAQLERDILKKAVSIFSRGDGFIKEHRNQFPVERMCKVLQVSTSGYYYWLKHPVGARAGKEQELVEQIKQAHQQSKCRYGSPRIAVELKEQGVHVSRPRVARLMQKHQVKSIIRKKYRMQTTDSSHAYTVAENHLSRDFHAAGPAEKWVSDLTYIRTGEGWLYLTVVLDLADRKVVGWALSETMEAEATTVAAWQMAIRNRPLFHSLLFHSDRGVQYACSAFREQLEGMPVLQSMSRKGNCWDNAVAESFFKTMKTEMVYHHKFATIAEAKLAVFEYIESFYNRKRRHSALGYLTPCQYESLLYNQAVAA